MAKVFDWSRGNSRIKQDVTVSGKVAYFFPLVAYLCQNVLL